MARKYKKKSYRKKKIYKRYKGKKRNRTLKKIVRSMIKRNEEMKYKDFVFYNTLSTAASLNNRYYNAAGPLEVIVPIT